jgi:electron transport complex protein RnfC
LKYYSFPRGGIDLEDPTAPPRSHSITAFLPNFSVIPYIHGAKNRLFPVVAIGDTVHEGSLIGRRQGPGTANVHASVPGLIERNLTWQTDSSTNEAFVISMGGSFDRLGKRERVFTWNTLSPLGLQQIITEYGVVEMEPNGMPLIDILSTFSAEKQPVTLIVRCVFDDPWSVAEYILCRERLDAVVEGALMLCHAIGAQQIIYAVSAPDQQLGRDLYTQAKTYEMPAFLALVSSRYPQSNKRELLLALQEYSIKEHVPFGSVLIEGPSTIAAVYDAVKFRLPILERYVAVGGSAVKNPSVFKVRLGTRIRELFDACGGFIDEPARIALGSPFLGQTIAELDEPILKQRGAVFALLKRQIGGTAIRSCINCGECRAICPVGLDPQQLYKQIVKPNHKPSDKVLNCHGCACCELVCPSRIPLANHIQQWSQHLKTEG